MNWTELFSVAIGSAKTALSTWCGFIATCAAEIAGTLRMSSANARRTEYAVTHGSMFPSRVNVAVSLL